MDSIAHAKLCSGCSTSTCSYIKTDWGITFTDKTGNIITENEDASENESEPEDIPVPPNDDDHDMQTENNGKEEE